LLSLFVFNVNLRLLMFICIWIWYFVFYWFGISDFLFPLGIRLRLWGIPLVGLHLHSLCFSALKFARITSYHASFTLTNQIWDPCHVGSLFLREAWLGWRQAFFRQGTATIVCRRVRRTLAYLFVSFVSHWHKVSVMCPTGTKVQGATAQRTCLPTGTSGFMPIVMVYPATRQAVRYHQVQEALTPT